MNDIKVGDKVNCYGYSPVDYDYIPFFDGEIGVVIRDYVFTKVIIVEIDGRNFKFHKKQCRILRKKD